MKASLSLLFCLLAVLALSDGRFFGRGNRGQLWQCLRGCFSDGYDPVCGFDERSYPNACFMECRNTV